MSEQTTPVNASNVVILDLKNLSGAIQFRVNINGELQWKLLTDSTWFTITNLELLRGRSITNVGVNVQNQFVLTFSDLTTQTLSIAALEDAITRATTAAQQALASASAAVAVAQGTETASPNVLPILVLDFASTKTLPTSCSFTRNSIGSYVNKYGVLCFAPINTPRFTHNPTTLESMGLLVEENRANLVSSSFVTNSYLSTTYNSGIAPDNTNTATLLKKNSTTNGVFSLPLTTTITDGFYVRSMFIKPISTTCLIAFEGVGAASGSGGALIFDAINKTFIGDTISPVSYNYVDYPNGWIRVSVTVEKSTTKIVATSMYLGGYGGSSTDSNDMFVWGVMVESGKSITSYIPPNTLRERDSPSIKSSYIPKSNLSLVVSGIKRGLWEKYQGGYNRVITNNTGIVLGFNPIAVQSWDITQSNIGDNLINCAVTVNSIRHRLCINGNSISLSSGYVDLSSLGSSPFYIGTGASGYGNVLNGTIKRISLYATELTDVEMVALTKNTLFGFKPNAAPTNGNLNELAYMDKATLLSLPSYNEFVLNGTGASLSMIIRRPYAFTFVLVESSSATFTSTPPASCSANTDYTIAFTAPVGKQLVYAICPIFDI